MPRPTTEPWTEAMRLDDEALIGEIVLAGIPEVATPATGRRARLLEALRARYEQTMRDVVARARVDVLRDPTAVADFLDFAWDPARILTFLGTWHGKQERGAFPPYLAQKARSLVVDFLRHRRRRGGPPREHACEPSARAADTDKAGSFTGALLEAARLCAEAVPIRYRAPWKLQYVTLFEVDDRDVAHLAAATRRPAEAVRARIAERRPAPGKRLPLVEIADLTGIAVASVGTYVARATRAIEACVRRRLERERAA